MLQPLAISHLKWITWFRLPYQMVVWFAGFKTPLGIVAISGLNLLPIYLYCHQFDLLSRWLVPSALQYVVFALLLAGRVLCAAVEVSILLVYFKFYFKQFLFILHLQLIARNSRNYLKLSTISWNYNFTYSWHICLAS